MSSSSNLPLLAVDLTNHVLLCVQGVFRLSLTVPSAAL